MPEASETVYVKLDANTAWARFGDFGAVGNWHPLLASVDSDGNAPGDVRQATGKDGSKQVERLDFYDGQRHVYRYHAEFCIEPVGSASSKVTWSAHFAVIGDEREGPT